MHAVADTYSSYAFAFLHISKVSGCAVLVLYNDVLPFYQEKNLSVKSVLTDNGRELCGKDNYPYELYLAPNDIEHRRSKIRSPKSNGFIELFNRTILDEFS